MRECFKQFTLQGRVQYIANSGSTGDPHSFNVGEKVLKTFLSLIFFPLFLFLSLPPSLPPRLLPSIKNEDYAHLPLTVLFSPSSFFLTRFAQGKLLSTSLLHTHTELHL